LSLHAGLKRHAQTTTTYAHNRQRLRNIGAQGHHIKAKAAKKKVSTNGEKNLINLVRGMYFHSTNTNRHDTDAPGLQMPPNSLSPVLKFLRDVYGSRKWKKIYWAQRYDRKCYQQSMETRLIRINC